VGPCARKYCRSALLHALLYSGHVCGRLFVHACICAHSPLFLCVYLFMCAPLISRTTTFFIIYCASARPFWHLNRAAMKKKHEIYTPCTQKYGHYVFNVDKIVLCEFKHFLVPPVHIQFIKSINIFKSGD
jgi:hypothetical protein